MQKSIGIVLVPGYVEDPQAKAMLTRRFTAKEGEPLRLRKEGLTIEYTAYGTVRITQHRAKEG